MVPGFLWSAGNAQDVVIPPSPNAFMQIFSGRTWGNSGTGGIHNAYILSVPYPASNTYLYLRNNNPTNNHAVKVCVFANFDPSIKKFIGLPKQTFSCTEGLNVGGWINVPLESNGSSIAHTVLNQGASLTYSFKPVAAAKLAIIVTGSTAQAGNPDTGDMYIAFAPNVLTPTITMFDSQRVTGNAHTSLLGNFFGSSYFGFPSELSACTFYVNASKVSGTNPTLNVYIEDFNYNLNINSDRVSFVQFTTVTAPGTTQVAGLNLASTASPLAITTAALGAGTTFQAGFTDAIDVQYTGGGTNPVYDVMTVGVCH